MATKREIDKHLEIALKEIGEIVPWYDKKFSAWIFEHRLYPVSYAGETKQEVVDHSGLPARRGLFRMIGS